MKRSHNILFLKQQYLLFLERNIFYSEDIKMTFLAILKVDMHQIMRKNT